jgi:NAD(P)-dependent dehydrogenase (short-subunit alcohol dehydrogenase family)
MTTPQRTIRSGFGARSTSDDVLRGIDLVGRLAIVTGGYSGLGLQTSSAFARAGATVVVPARRPAAAREALHSIGAGSIGAGSIEVDELDLADLASVHRFAERFLASGRDIDIIVNNAGIMACPETRVGPGWEAQFAINHLGPYALVNLLWPAIARRGDARIVAVASGNRFAGIRWDDVHLRRGYDKWQAYTQSKAANVLFAAQLDTFGRAAGVRAFSANPGYVLTPLQRHLSQDEMIAAGWIDADGNQLGDDFKTPAQGAATQVWAATSPRLAGMGGVYCQDCDIAETDSATEPSPGDSQAVQAARMWTLSAELTGLDAFAAAH